MLKTILILLVTTYGNITVELYPDKAPKTVDNFVKYVEAGQYNGTIFHRVIDGFMIQGGGFTTNLQEKPTRAPVKNEAGNDMKNARGTVAMARRGDPDSATAQFFINTVDNGFLDRANARDGYGYTVFGQVVDGMDVVDRIGGSRTHQAMLLGQRVPDVPLEPIVITKAQVVKSLEEAKALSAKPGTPEQAPAH